MIHRQLIWLGALLLPLCLADGAIAASADALKIVPVQDGGQAGSEAATPEIGSDDELLKLEDTLPELEGEEGLNIPRENNCNNHEVQSV